MSPGRTARGFSLVELTVVLAVGAILVVTAVPNLTQYVQNQRVIAISNDMIAQVNRARSEAMKRNEMVVMCSANVLVNNPLARSCLNRLIWSNGSIMYVQARDDADFALPSKEPWDQNDDNMEMLQVTEPRTASELRVRASTKARNGIGFLPDGTVVGFDSAGDPLDEVAMIGEALAFSVCQLNQHKNGRIVQISHTGRTRIMKTDDPNASANCTAND